MPWLVSSSIYSEISIFLLLLIICICPIMSFWRRFSNTVFSWKLARSSSVASHLRLISMRNCQPNANIRLSITITAYFSATEFISRLIDFSIKTRLRHCSLLLHSKNAVTIFFSYASCSRSISLSILPSALFSALLYLS